MGPPVIQALPSSTVSRILAREARRRLMRIKPTHDTAASWRPPTVRAVINELNVA
jgi:hypothetical protein